MPCICHQCSGIDLLRSTSCVPEHPLFCHDGYHCRDQRKGSRDGDRSAGCTFYNITDTGNSDAKTCYKQHPRKNNGRNALHSLMSVLMLLVRFFCRKTDTDDNNKSTSHIGCRMDRIRNHRSGMRRNSGSRPDCRPALPACPGGTRPGRGAPTCSCGIAGGICGKPQ